MKAGKVEVKDDRPPDNISFAATNLVKPGLQSRRQQSEPPTNRNVFPPTPPPEGERAERGERLNRGSGSIRGQKPSLAKLNIQQAEPGRRYERASPPDSRPRPTRSASANPGKSSQRERDPLTLQLRQREIPEEDNLAGDVYDMYQSSGRRNSRNSRRSPQSGRPDDDSEYDDGSVDENEFEMMGARRRPGSGSSRGGRRVEVTKIRVKVHADDVRYIMVKPGVQFTSLADKVREKFGIRNRFKIKIKDEDMPSGDMITMGDQDDLDMAVDSAKDEARRARQETAKMEVRTLNSHLHCGLLTTLDRFGSLRFRQIPLLFTSFSSLAHIFRLFFFFFFSYLFRIYDIIFFLRQFILDDGSFFLAAQKSSFLLSFVPCIPLRARHE